MRAAISSSVVFMGTPSFSVPFLDAIINSGRPVLSAVTQPDRPQGRGKKIIPSPVKEYALLHNIPVVQPLRLSDLSFTELIKALRPRYIVVVAFGKIIPPGILAIPEKGCINVHASLLPEYRGASPIQWAIVEGKTWTGITTMMMAETLDTGDILLQERITIGRKDTAGSMSLKLSEIGVDLLIKTLDGLDRDEIVPQPQDHSKATYAPLIKKGDGLINWNDKSGNISNKIRGFDPWPGTYTYYQGVKWGIRNAEVMKTDISQWKAGEIIVVQPDGIMVATGDQALKITEIQAEGKKRMRVADYLRGHKVERGVILGIEVQHIDSL